MVVHLPKPAMVLPHRPEKPPGEDLAQGEASVGEGETVEREPPAYILGESRPRLYLMDRGEETGKPPHVHGHYSKGVGLCPAARMRQGGGTTASLFDWTARRPAFFILASRQGSFYQV